MRSFCTGSRTITPNIAEVPELAGCMADGPTAKDALHNVELIAQEWIETARELGRPVPKGRLKYA